jgi:hypothetical protein
MAFPLGTHVVERDHAVLAALGIARYLTIDQLTRLVFAGRDERVARRRMSRLASPGPNQMDPLVAVLPFADLSPQHDQEYFADGVAERS